MTPSDARFAKRFLVVTPGITIRDRLGCSTPSATTTTTASATSCRPICGTPCCKAQVEIINYHAFLPRDAKEIKGVAANTASSCVATTGDPDAFRETPDEVAARILRDFGSRQGRDRRPQRRGPSLLPGQAARDPDEKAEKEDKDRNREARVWFRGLASCKQLRRSRRCTTCRRRRTT